MPAQSFFKRQFFILSLLKECMFFSRILVSVYRFFVRHVCRVCPLNVYLFEHVLLGKFLKYFSTSFPAKCVSCNVQTDVSNDFTFHLGQASDLFLYSSASLCLVFFVFLN